MARKIRPVLPTSPNLLTTKATGEVVLSSYGRSSSTPSPVNRMMAGFAEDFRDGYDINLGVGYVNEQTIPRDLLLEAFEAVVSNPDRYRQPFNYGGPTGSANLKRSIVSFLARNRIGNLDESLLGQRTVLIGASGATSLLEAIGQVLEPGIIVTSDPLYYIYTDFLLRKGFEILAVPEDAEGIDTGLLSEKLEDLGDRRRAIRAMVVVTVNNPTSTILSGTRRMQLVEIVEKLSAEVGHEVPLLCDTAYELLIHDPSVDPPPSALTFDRKGLVYEIGTLSKILAPALRVGYLIGPDNAFTRSIVQHTSDVGFSAPLMAQEMASYLLDHGIEDQIRQVNQGYRARSVRVHPWLESILGDYLEEIRGGQAGFYHYLTFRRADTREGSLFQSFLSRKTGTPSLDGAKDSPLPRVVTIPGEFCVHPQGDLAEKGTRQLRISYGFETPDRIRRGIEILREAVEFTIAAE